MKFRANLIVGAILLIATAAFAQQKLNGRVIISDYIDLAGTTKINGTTLSASAAQLNAVAVVTPGTVTASKGVVVDASKDIASFGSVTANQYRVTNAAQLSAANPTPTKANMQAASFWSVTTASNAVDVDLPAMDAVDVGMVKRFAVTTGHATQALTVTSGTLTVTTHNTLGTTCEDAQDHIDCLITSTTTASCDTFCAD